jgi:DNA invertase Pin-like site-specific DNA recombinase
MRKAIAYIRVSSEDQIKGNDIDLENAKLTKLSDMHQVTKSMLAKVKRAFRKAGLMSPTEEEQNEVLSWIS